MIEVLLVFSEKRRLVVFFFFKQKTAYEIAGVRLPDVTVPLATYTGWALRRGAQANDGCEAAGQFIPFAKTEAGPVKTNDPRPSIEARYKTFAGYHGKLRSTLEQMGSDRLL